MQTVETLNEGLKRAFKITIPARDISARVDKELKSVAPNIRMPGFRPGKVPANLVRKMHGPALEQQALENAVQEGVQQLIAEQNLRPATQPEVELDQRDQGADAVVTVTLETLPDVPTPQIEGLKLERLTVEADDSTVDQRLQQLAQGQKSFDPAPADYAAQMGDLAVIDYEGRVDGELFEGGKGEGMSIELGSGRLIPGFEDQLVGVKANEQRTVNVTFPEDYPVEYLKGRDAVFEVTVNEVQKPREMVADDDFAKAMGLEGIDQLRQLLKGQVEQELNGLTRTHMKRQLLDQLAASHDFAVPPSMVDAEFDQIWRQLDHEASHEADPAAARAEMENEREDYRKIAERRVRLGLLLSEIGQANGVEISSQEMNQLIMQAAQQYRPQDRQKFVDYIRQQPMAAAQLRAPLFEDKVVDFLFEKADITDRSVSREELESQIEAEDMGHVHGPDCNHDHDHDHGHHHHGHDHDHDHAPAPAPKARKSKKASAGDDATPADAAPAEAAAAASAVEAPAEAAPVKKASRKKSTEAAPAEAAPAPTEEAEAPAAAPKKRASKKADAPAEAPVAEAAAAEDAVKPAKKSRSKKAE